MQYAVCTYRARNAASAPKSLLRWHKHVWNVLQKKCNAPLVFRQVTGALVETGDISRSGTPCLPPEVASEAESQAAPYQQP
mmetsp:Transcript_4398/g.15772  ORF Transcript_4398/g.15772 Transcript_4398/m.15772 type:complete len:81 (+) Transcript_4398:338-580(+)